MSDEVCCAICKKPREMAMSEAPYQRSVWSQTMVVDGVEVQQFLCHPCFAAIERTAEQDCLVTDGCSLYDLRSKTYATYLGRVFKAMLAIQAAAV